MTIIRTLTGLHERAFAGLERALDGWFIGLAARFAFAGVLLVYYFNSFLTKIGGGVFGFLSIQDGAYFQIVPQIMERYDFDVSQVPLPYDLVVIAGTYTEFLLPALIVAGLFTRLAALAMIGFIIVQSYVDIAFHGVDDKTVGALFDRFSVAAIMDQRTLWIFLLVVLAAKGAGAISLDACFTRKTRPDG